MADMEKVKEQMKKALEVPVETHVQKLFEKLDPQNTGSITVEAFVAAGKEFQKQFEGLPKDPKEEEHKKAFEELLAKNQTDGKMNKAQATAIFTTILEGIKKHMSA
ncbi:MAG: hypothetical protein MJ252_23265 [archaeon]|nr:hypothetical protein [archaeon]